MPNIEAVHEWDQFIRKVHRLKAGSSFKWTYIGSNHRLAISVMQRILKRRYSVSRIKGDDETLVTRVK